MFAQVLLFQKTGLNSDTLTYQIPEGMKISAGALVQVPLRKKSVRGIILEITNKKNVPGTIRPIEKILHPELLSVWRVELLDILSKNITRRSQSSHGIFFRHICGKIKGRQRA